ncbi:CoA-binding protein [Providencia stuartii]|uniref:CoA-binding protein n=1 Tax=Providencia TaxID=586 RepID=UPI001123B6CB|nr:MULTISPECIES: CoA-binding protein [Providencia]ELR5039875.1 CoA-binding protein [Providencia stuartii]ELR5082854.1 CoA-binding protein [Providencia stuartii]ELR5300499.1 CoA-binding protein [Providencia stuartii]MDW7588136.1 CoA-binding protein [Providencia sp. 2023EL-00965]
MASQEIAEILRSVNTIALVGASDKKDRPSYEVMEYLLEQGYTVIPVSPKLAGQTLLGQTVYAKLSEIPQPIDMVDVFRNAEAAVGVAHEAVEARAKVLWLQKGVVSEEAQQIALDAGMQCVMDRCPKQEIPALGLEK